MVFAMVSPRAVAAGARKGRGRSPMVPNSWGAAAGSHEVTAAVRPSVCISMLAWRPPDRCQGRSCGPPGGVARFSRTASARRAASVARVLVSVSVMGRVARRAAVWPGVRDVGVLRRGGSLAIA
jgi:hypothetical protein